MTTDTTTWLCPRHPFGHQWNGGLTCTLCSARRTAREALLSIVEGARGQDRQNAQRLLNAFRAEVLEDAGGDDNPAAPTVGAAAS